ncbi:MAG: hypothetical protein RIQ81_2274 [Pseudomonadota bacterium]
MKQTLVVCMLAASLLASKAVAQASTPGGAEENSLGFKTSTPRRIPAPGPNVATPRIKGDLKKLCRDAFFQYALPLKKIARKHAGTFSGDDSKSATDILALDPSDCDDLKRRVALITTLSRTLNTHTQLAIALLPEPTGNAGTDAASAAMETGLKSAFPAANAGQLRIMRIRETTIKSVDDLLESAISRALWTEKPALLISGLDPAMDDLLAGFASAVGIPVVVMGPPPVTDSDQGTGKGASQDLKKKNKKSLRMFRIFPDQAHLARLLAQTACNRGLKKVGILRPSSPESGSFARAFENTLAGCSGFVARGGTYAKPDYEAVDAAVKQISESLQGGTGTGIVILDDARIARHAAKVLKNHGIHGAVLMGHHRWRSPTIVQPFDTLFEQSVFVDYLGTSNLPEFPDAATSWQAIWELNGKRAGQLAVATVNAGKGYPRKNLHRIMATLPAPSDPFFGSKSFFSPTQTSWWPAFAFTITRGALAANPAVMQGDAPLP